MDSPIVIIGAGLGGLSVAIDLATRGFKVILLEKNSAPGGKMGELRWGSYRFDTGPSLLTMPFVLDSLLGRAGLSLNGSLHLKRLEPICRYFFPSGQTIDASHDLDEFGQRLSCFEPHAVMALQRYLSDAAKAYELTAPLFLFAPFPSSRLLFSPLALQSLANARIFAPWRTVHQAHTSYFSHPSVQQLFDRYATYAGANPYLAPSTLNVISHVEYGLGSFYPHGGLYGIAKLLAQVAKGVGVDIRYHTPVAEILLKGRRVGGVRLAQGDTIYTPAVVSNVDALYTYTYLIRQPTFTRWLLRRQARSLSGIILHWAVANSFPQLAHHNIFFSRSYRDEFHDIFNGVTLPVDPTIYLAITAKSDREHAPLGCENWFILLNVHPGCRVAPNPEKLRAALLERLQAREIPIKNSDIVWERVRYPADLADETSSIDGALYGSAPHSLLSAFLRPANKNPIIRGLYMVGGSVHPGGGIPLTLLSGLITGRLIARTLRADDGRAIISSR